jgi:hypothetical protein
LAQFHFIFGFFTKMPKNVVLPPFSEVNTAIPTTEFLAIQAAYETDPTPQNEFNFAYALIRSGLRPDNERGVSYF